ncbi:hypothetical protein ACFLVL_03000 [Chloroflexota bacterium]
MMKPQDAQTVYKEIVAHIKKQSGSYSKWYAGIASDWEDRLFVDHQVPKEHYWYIARQCHNDEDARAVEKSLHSLGCDGSFGGGDPTTVYVYAYLKSGVTNP